MHSLVIINHSSFVDIYQQLEYLKTTTTIPVEIVDETDNRLNLYAKKPDRFPVFILFKNNIKQSIKQGNLNKPDFLKWIKDTTRSE